jgi:hypothetical protein
MELSNFRACIGRLLRMPIRFSDYTANSLQASETSLILQGRMLSQQLRNIPLQSLSDAEFKVFSQFGDDGIIQYLIQNIAIEKEYFIEFGVADYVESNTRFLLMNNNWSGLVMDCSSENVQKIKNSYYYWKHDLIAKHAFVTVANINDLISSHVSCQNIGLLHIDVDGNDYWIWDAIHVVEPTIVVMEYNGAWGNSRAITVPYNEQFDRLQAHYSNIYYGASLCALNCLAKKKGYSFIGCNNAGNNAYFVRSTSLNDRIRPVSISNGFVERKFREERDSFGSLTYRKAVESQSALVGLPVFDVEASAIVPF